MQRKLGLMIFSVLVLVASLVAFERYVYKTYIYKPADYKFNYKIKPRKAMKGPKFGAKPFPKGPMIRGASLILPDILLPVGALVTAFLSVFMFRRLLGYRRRKQLHEPTEEGDPQTFRQKTVPLDWPPERQRQQTDSVSEVRQLIASFDRQLPDGSKRRPEETVQDWLDRIKLAIDPMLYHMVRYGEIDDQTLDRSEIDALRNRLNQRLRG